MLYDQKHSIYLVSKLKDGENNGLIRGKCSQVIYPLILLPIFALNMRLNSPTEGCNKTFGHLLKTAASIIFEVWSAFLGRYTLKTSVNPGLFILCICQCESCDLFECELEHDTMTRMACQ